MWEGEADLEGVEDVLGAVLVGLLGRQLGLLELQELPPKNLGINTDVYCQYLPHCHPQSDHGHPTNRKLCYYTNIEQKLSSRVSYSDFRPIMTPRSR